MTSDIFVPRNGVILTGKGRWLDLNEAMPDFDIEEIAIALSVEPRFGGSLKRPYTSYSVAQHSVYTARLMGRDPRKRLAGLMHDGTEGVGFKDLPRPVKYLFPDYVRAEKECGGKMALWQGLPVDAFEHADVKNADNYMLAMEAKQMHAGAAFFNSVMSTDRTIFDIDPGFEVWSSEVAEAMFLNEYHSLRCVIDG